MLARRTERRAKAIAYFAVFVAVGLETASLGPTLPGLAEQTETALGAISFLFTGHALGYMLGSFLGGRLYDRMPGHPVMAAMLALMAAMLVAIPFLQALWLLAAAWLLLGVAGGGLDVGGNTLLVWVYGREVGPYMNGLHFFFGVGSFLGPLIVALVVEAGGRSVTAYWILALLVLPVIAWLFGLRSPAAPAAREEERWGGGSGRPGRWGGEGLLVGLIALLLLLYVAAEAAFGGWIYTYAVALDLSDGATAAYLTSAFWGALTLGRLLGIPLAARFRPRAILLVDLVGCLASSGLLLLWPSSREAIWVGTLGLGLSMASIFPTVISLAERHVRITGQVTAWFLIGSSVGAMFLPWLIGQLFEPVGPQVTIWIILVDLAAAVGMLAVLLAVSDRRVLVADAGGGS